MKPLIDEYIGMSYRFTYVVRNRTMRRDVGERTKKKIPTTLKTSQTAG